MENSFSDFAKLIRDQFEYGGKKYAFSKEKEVTDILTDNFGKNWLLGTIAKYTFRIKNLKRERDILKIATYSMIIWLKRGYFIDDRRINMLYTNVKMKKQNFGLFIKRVKSYANRTFNLDVLDHSSNIDYINEIYKILLIYSTKEFYEITEEHIFAIYFYAYLYWLYNFLKNQQHDTDTYNYILSSKTKNIFHWKDERKTKRKR
jgi:hypothetical protein